MRDAFVDDNPFANRRRLPDARYVHFKRSFQHLILFDCVGMDVERRPTAVRLHFHFHFERATAGLDGGFPDDELRPDATQIERTFGS